MPATSKLLKNTSCLGISRIGGLVIFAGLSLLSGATPLNAAPCYPNDPDGSNPGNLCLTYSTNFTTLTTTGDDLPLWSPLPNRPTNQPPFIPGVGKEAYYGYRVSPTQPGRVVGTTSGYWTNIEAVNGSTTIKDSHGQTISIP